MPETLAHTHPRERDDMFDPEAKTAGRVESSLPADLRFDFSRTAIFFDIDGTLLDLAPTPLEVSVSTRLQNSLATLQDFFRGRDQLEYDENLDPATLVDTAPGENALELLGQ